jgi:acyl carrier protein
MAKDVEAALVAAIRSCLEASGKSAVEINPETVPLEDIPGFDSLCAVEVLVDLESRFELRAESDVFLDGQGSNARKRTIREIAQAIGK